VPVRRHSKREKNAAPDLGGSVFRLDRSSGGLEIGGFSWNRGRTRRRFTKSAVEMEKISLESFTKKHRKYHGDENF
jgi:hypothetical protein